ncbi:glycoside hydrolase family 15 protein [Microvirga arsenatis]|uniref:Glycoside hydrolase family 15 protein n=1 Tax=Microvirga arsenatis TaxID=2692265 RepID=A0ABW9YSU8_9HYPH|nr:glycoside hydrolase family 15 protein [Microvirga arsenatis]NBJ09733.1 glycoside hydrolase family 15 protein [Microvirga arsenatis]NBJ23408.1 glycoside hydrolase family 15 protein [Microvirga arsenatis]
MSSLDLAVIGNCMISALVDRRAQIVWSCFPRFDGDPVFSALLDCPEGQSDADQKGVFAIDMAGMVSCEQSYLQNTAVLVSRLTDSFGNIVEITDFAPRFKHFDRTFRPPMLVRRVQPVKGRPRIRLRLRPHFDWGNCPPGRTRGSNHLRFVGPDYSLRLTTDAPISYVQDERFFVVDRPMSFFFGEDEPLRSEADTTARAFLDSTVDFWRDWVRSLSIPFDWQEAVIRAAITLKLCNFEETGAIVAALTTSVPEAPHTQRNWDYRYCWLRDAYFVIQALNRLGTTKTMEEYLTYITNIVDDMDSNPDQKDMPPLFSITRSPDLEEREATALAGYRGMGPVRVGNAAYTQIQNDAYGSVVLASVHAFLDKRLIRTGNRALFEHLEKLGERAVEVFDKPDAGPWELRTKAAVHTFPSVMCWAACDRLVKIAEAMGREDRAAYWRENAERMHQVINERAFNPKTGTFVSSFDGEHLDATLLLLAELDFVKADDPRFVATVEAVGKTLRRGDLLLRYDVEDDFGRMHTAFMICGFWYVDALWAIGRKEEARELFEHILSLRNSFGLFSEDADFTTGELWGNFPQTYSMVGLINSAVRLSRSWEEAF